MVSSKSYLPFGTCLGYWGLAVGMGTLPSPRRAGAGSLCSAPDSPLDCPLSQPPWQQHRMMSLPAQVCQRNTTAPHIPQVPPEPHCPALCTLVTHAMGTDSDCPLGIRFRGLCDFTCQWPGWRQQPPVRHKRRNVCVCVCVSKRGQYLWQGTAKLLPLPHSTGGTCGVTALSDSHHQAEQCGQLSTCLLPADQATGEWNVTCLTQRGRASPQSSLWYGGRG